MLLWLVPAGVLLLTLLVVCYRYLSNFRQEVADMSKEHRMFRAYAVAMVSGSEVGLPCKDRDESETEDDDTDSEGGATESEDSTEDEDDTKGPAAAVPLSSPASHPNVHST
jgi:hypothetical protein